MTKKVIASMGTVLCAFALSVGTSWAGAGNASGTGQPNQSCETTGTTPGQSSSASGSAFNPDGTAGTQYAGEQPQNSNNEKSVSQYDVACSKQ